MVKLSATELLERYTEGERDFRRVQLQGAFLKEVNLSYIDLCQADLSYANLSGINLSYAKLQQATLNHTNLSGANLTKINLTQASLTKACLNHACLIGAFMTKASLCEASLIKTQLKNAHLNEADLNKAILDGANLNKAYLMGAYLGRVSLKGANLDGTYFQGANIENAQFQGAYYNSETHFASGFDPAFAEMQKVEIITIEKLLVIFNHISQCSTQYLGKTMTIKFWQCYRPKYDWFNQFEINASTGQFKFSGVTTDQVSILDLYLSRKWMRNFIDACSQMIKNFADLLQLESFEFDLAQGSSPVPMS